MKLKTLLAFALLLSTFGCAQKKAEAPNVEAPNLMHQETSASDEEAEKPGSPPPSTGGTAVCDSPECQDECGDAGELKDACAEAFAKGCMSDVKPDDFDCDWEKKSKRKLKPHESRGATTSDDALMLEEESKAEEPAKDETPKAQMEDEMD